MSNLTLPEIFGRIVTKRAESRDKLIKELARHQSDIGTKLAEKIMWERESVLSNGSETEGFKESCKKIAFWEALQSENKRLKEEMGQLIDIAMKIRREVIAQTDRIIGKP